MFERVLSVILIIAVLALAADVLVLTEPAAIQGKVESMTADNVIVIYANGIYLNFQVSESTYRSTMIGDYVFLSCNHGKIFGIISNCAYE